jgi:hypothetical protein
LHEAENQQTLPTTNPLFVPASHRFVPAEMRPIFAILRAWWNW